MIIQLAALDAAHPFTRKLLVAPDIGWGREVILALARRLGEHVGWETTTLLGMAEELAFTELGQRRLRRASDVELTALMDRALAAACAERAVSDAFAGLATGLGFRRAVKDAVLTLRAAGVSAEQVRSSIERHAPAWDAGAVLARYERLLGEAHQVDPAGLLQLALERFDSEAPHVLGAPTVLAAELNPTGLGRSLLDRLRMAGAVELEPLVPRDGAAPVRSGASDLDFFLAASPGLEIVEVLRRVVQEGRTWDEVEIVATDRDAYGIALDAICQREGITCTLFDGVPLARTRVGRAAERWLAWLSDGLPAGLVREALEAGDLALDGAEPDAATQAVDMLRRLNIGWGRARYEQARTDLLEEQHITRAMQRDGEDDSEYAERLARYRVDGAALLPLLDRILAVTPPVPEHGSHAEEISTCARLAAALAGLLALFPLRDSAEQRTLSRIQDRLTELAAADDRTTTFALALAELRDALNDLRAWTGASPAEHPRMSRGGAIHLTDIVHGGTTGRPRVFVVGLDADRVGGSAVQDPVLPDSARRAIAPDALPSSAERREAQRWQLAAMLARLTGKATLSLSLAGSGPGDTSGPAHVLLEVFRQAHGGDVGYEALRAALGEPASAVPGDGAALATRGVWLAAIAGGSSDYRNGERLVRSAWPMLDAGLSAAAMRTGDRLTAWHGLVPAAAGRLDPRTSESPISPTSLEQLSACPLAWFYHYGLGLVPPDDAEFDPERWLDPMARGSLLHAAYEAMGRAYLGRQAELLSDAAREQTLAITEALLARYRHDVPPPSSAVYETEAGEIRASALAFLEVERENARAHRTTWGEFELRFGRARAVRFALEQGSIPVRGSIDRVDRQRDGRLVVIDYKTGSPDKFERHKGTGPFRGGRHLQPGIYATAARTVMAADVARFEYRFPTVRGENRKVPYAEEELALTSGIVSGLMRQVERGEFIPTTEAEDCTWCAYAPICRVTCDEYHKATSPRAEWAKQHAEALAEYADMLRRRAPE